MPQGMEPDTKKYLLKVLNSLSVGSLWLILNMWSGLYLGYAIIGKSLSIQNVLFYVWFAGSLALVIRFYYRTWK